MISLHEAQKRQYNPLDLLEEMVTANDWAFDRASDSELMVEVSGHWCDYHLCFVWQEDVAAILFSSHFDQKIPGSFRAAVLELLAAFNETLWLGHFEMTSDEGIPLFRHTVPLRGIGGASVEQMEDLVDTALTESERFYPALQMVVWGGRPVLEALQASLMETVGEA